MGTIKCTDLCKNYRQKKVLDNVNLTIEEGKIYGLIGRCLLYTSPSPRDTR